MKTINIVDSGCDRYTIKSDCYCLGRMWEHLAEQIQVLKPKGEDENVCTMIVSANGVVIDHIDIKDEPKDITNVLTRHPVVEISFTFTNETGYTKNSEIKGFYFEEGRKPEDFVPVEPEQTGKIDILLAEAFIRVEQDGNIIRFFNANGDLSQEIMLDESVTEYNELEGKPSINGVELVGNKTTEELGIVSQETDPTVPAWAKSPNKPTYSYEEITNKPSFANVSRTGSYNDLIDKPNIPSVDGLASEIYVDNKANETLQDSKTYTDNKISALINSAPETLDTLGEIAKSLEENQDVVDTLNSAIGNKADKTELADYVKFTDYATQTKAGVVKIGSNATGLQFDPSGYLKTVRAATSDIDNKTDGYKVIVSSNLDYAVKSGVTDNAISLTDEEKTKVANWLGVLNKDNITLTLKDNGAYTLTINKG